MLEGVTLEVRAMAPAPKAVGERFQFFGWIERTRYEGYLTAGRWAMQDILGNEVTGIAWESMVTDLSSMENVTLAPFTAEQIRRKVGAK